MLFSLNTCKPLVSPIRAIYTTGRYTPTHPHWTDTCIYSNPVTYNWRNNLTACSSFYSCVSCLCSLYLHVHVWIREPVCFLECKVSGERVFLPPLLLACEVKEQLEVGLWHYIFNEASQLFSCTVVAQRAERRTLTLGAQLTSHQQTASSGGGCRVKRCLETLSSPLAGRSLTERVTTGCRTASRSSPSDPTHVVSVTLANQQKARRS